MNSASPTVELGQKSSPRQSRSRQTYEMILLAAGELLAKVGLERFTTNQVCRHAKLTPPALYRYFPNKYALLVAMGERLMDAQDDALFAWIERGGMRTATIEQAYAQFHILMREMVRITAEQPGGVWVMRAMRATPVLRQVRINSRERVVDRLFRVAKPMNKEISDTDLRLALRLDTELVTAAIEWLLEEPGGDAERSIQELFWNRHSYFENLRIRSVASQARKPHAQRKQMAAAGPRGRKAP